jgi:hypothetical protein
MKYLHHPLIQRQSSFILDNDFTIPYVKVILKFDQLKDW